MGPISAASFAAWPILLASSFPACPTIHVTQSGNGAQKLFFPRPTTPPIATDCPKRRARRVSRPGQLTPNHVHLVLALEGEEGLRHALARVHRSYAGMVYARHRGGGHFWQGRFGASSGRRLPLCDAEPGASSPGPPRGRLAVSSVHVGFGDGALTDLVPGRRRFSRFAALLEGDEDSAATSRLRKGESVGRPIGSESLLAALEAQTQRRLRPLERGPKPTDDRAG
jgi:putative transposase